jgi:hypothetical protein
VDDRDELFERASKLRAQPDEQAPLGQLDEHSRRQPPTENAVLSLEVGHVAGQLTAWRQQAANCVTTTYSRVKISPDRVLTAASADR